MASQVPGVSSSYPPHTTLHQPGANPNPAVPAHQLHQQSHAANQAQQGQAIHQQGGATSTGPSQGQHSLQTSSIFFDSEIKKGSEIVIPHNSQHHGMNKLLPDIKEEVLVDQQQDVYLHESKQASPELEEVGMYATSSEITSTAADSIYSEISQAAQVAVCSSTSMMSVNQPHSSGLFPEGGTPKPSQSDKSHMCLTCGKAFRNKPQLTQHELVHNGIRKHVCSYCEKAFKQICHLNQHIRVHTGERPYKCTMEGCGRSFAQLSNLNHHQKNHEEHVRRDVARHFRCEVCDRSYANQNSLQTHIMKLHTGIKEGTIALHSLSSPQPKKKKKTVVKTEESQIYSSSADPGDTYLVDFTEAEEDGLPSQVRTKSSLSPKMVTMTPVPLESTPQSSGPVRTAASAPMSVQYQNSPAQSALSEHYQNSPQAEGQGHTEAAAAGTQSSGSDRGASVEVVSSSTYSQATRDKLAQYHNQQQQQQQQKQLQQQLQQQQQQREQRQQQQQQKQHQSFGQLPREATPSSGLSQRETTPGGINDLASIQLLQQHHARLLQQKQSGQGQGHSQGQGLNRSQSQGHGDRSSPLVSHLPPRSSPLMQQQQQHQQHQQQHQQQQHQQQQHEQQVVTEAPSRVTHHYPEAGSHGKAGSAAGRPQLFNPAFSDNAGRYTQNQF